MQRILATLAVFASPLLAQQSPSADIWLDNGGVVRQGDIVNVHYTADRGSYITVLRFDADGWMTMLVPSSPNDRTKISAATERLVTFKADEAPGVGTVFAIASRTPFDFSGYRDQDDSWRQTPNQTGRVDLGKVVSRVARQLTGGGQYTLSSVDYRVGEQGSSNTAVVTPTPYESQGLYSGNGYGIGLYDPRYDPMYGNGYGYNYGQDGLLYYQPLYRRRILHGSRPLSRPNSPSGMTNLHRCPDGTLVPPSVYCLPARGQLWSNPPSRLRPQPPRHFTPRPSAPQIRPWAPRQHQRPAGPPPAGRAPTSPPNGHHRQR